MTQPFQAATVVLLRNSGQGLQTLLLQRSDRGVFANQWVFPGGAVEPSDQHDAADNLAAARHAAVRECEEEAGIRLVPDSLLPMAHWVPPAITSAKRFATWFFVAEITTTREVQIDNQEIVNHCWLAPSEALTRQSQGQLALMPPTFITLTELANRNSLTDALAFYQQRGIFDFSPQLHPTSAQDNWIFLYQGDAEHATHPGKGYHRLKMQGTRYHYQATFEPEATAPDHY